jgi:hypothetical protein
MIIPNGFFGCFIVCDVLLGLLSSVLLLEVAVVEGCSDVLVTPGASTDGSAMIAYNADDVTLYGVLYHYPKTTNNDVDDMIPVYNWDTGVRRIGYSVVNHYYYLCFSMVYSTFFLTPPPPLSSFCKHFCFLVMKKYLGKIPQVKETYNVVGNGNEYGLVIGESTFGGVSTLANQPGAVIDYGSLIYLTLQRSKTARSAIQTMAQLMGKDMTMYICSLPWILLFFFPFF